MDDGSIDDNGCCFYMIDWFDCITCPTRDGSDDRRLIELIDEMSNEDVEKKCLILMKYVASRVPIFYYVHIIVKFHILSLCF